MSRRRIAIAACVAVAVAALVVIGVATELRGSEAEPLSISSDPPIAVVWAERGWAEGTAAGDLYVVHGDGTSRAIRQWRHGLRDGEAYGAFNALWSPDRGSIALSLAVWESDPGSRVAVISNDGRGLRQLTKGWERELVSWSMDGEGLIHTNFWASSDRGLESVRAAGGPSTRLTILPARNWRIHGLDWSRDGKRIVAALRDSGLVTMDSRGRNLVHVTRADDRDPRWSPDGRSVLFTRSTYNEELDEVKDDVYLVGAGGQVPRALTSDGFSSAVGWSPDGGKILFLRRAVDEAKPNQDWWELWVMNAEGGQQTRLPFNRPGWTVLAADWGDSP